MPTIAVINRKGGSGKSTLATNIAGWCASFGWKVMLGDVDRQQSVRSWLRRRHPSAPAVTTWVVDNGKMLRAPRGTTHAVLDTPGAVYDYALSKIVVWVDAVVVPIGPSIFDRDASIACIEDLKKHPRIMSGRCKLVAVGMRWPSERIEEWRTSGKQWDVPLLTIIPEDHIYRECLEKGYSVFDLDVTQRQSQTAHWEPLLEWLSTFWAGNVATLQVQTSAQNQAMDKSPTEELAGGEVVGSQVGEPSSSPNEHPHNQAAIPAYLLKNTVAHKPTITNTEPERSKQPPHVAVSGKPPTVKLAVTSAALNGKPAETAAVIAHETRSWIARLLRTR